MSNENHIFRVGFLLTILGMVVGEWALRPRVSDLAQRFTATTESIILKKEEMLSRIRSPADVLFLGDSTVNAAIDESIFQHEGHGARALNLGLVGDITAYGDYWALTRYLARMPSAKLVVIWHTVDVWPRSLNLALFGFTRPPLAVQWEAILNTVRNLEYTVGIVHWPVTVLAELVEGQLYQISDLYRYRIWIKKIAAQKVGAIDPLSVLERLPKSYAQQENRVKKEQQTMRKLSLFLSKDNRYWFQRCLALAQSRGIRVCVSRSPVNEEFIEDPEVRAKLDRENAELVTFFGQFPGVQDLAVTNVVLPRNYFNDDKDHVNDVGKAYLTRLYLRLLRPLL